MRGAEPMTRLCGAREIASGASGRNGGFFIAGDKIENATDQVVWATDYGKEISPQI